MPLFLYHGKYINAGTRALVSDSGTKREAAIRTLIESVGGTCLGVYFGTDSDAYAIANLPDTKAATFVNLTWNATGRLDVKMVPLLAPAEFDKVCQTPLTPEFRGPGE